MSHNDIDVEEYEQRKTFLEDLKILNKVEKEEVYRILKKNFATLSENSNGIFFDLSAISDETFFEIKDYLHFCSTTRQEHDYRMKELESLRSENQQLLNEHSNK